MPIPKFVVTAGLMIAQMALTMTRTIEGPRLKDLQVSAADPGTPIPNGIGRVRVAAPCFYAEPLKEKKKKRKTKGGKVKDYLYYATSAWVFAGHETRRVRRIWFDKHLVYDAIGTVSSLGESGDTVEDLDGNNTTFADLTDIYLGTEDQEPDPRMLAYIEAREGPDTCPAYRGLSFLIAKDFPADKLGNRNPSIVEVEYDGIVDPLDSTVIEGHNQFFPNSVSPNGRYVISAVNNDTWQTLDLDTETISTVTRSELPNMISVALDDDGTVYGLVGTGSGGTSLRMVEDFGAGTITTLEASLPATSGFNLRLFIMPDASRKLYWSAQAAANNSAFVYDVTADTTTTVANPEAAADFFPLTYVQDSYDDVWVFGGDPPGAVMIGYAWRVTDNGAGSAAPDLNTFTTHTGASSEAAPIHTPSGWFVSWNNGRNFYLLDEDDFSQLAHRSYSSGLNNDPVRPNMLYAVPPGSTEFWMMGRDSTDNYVDVERIRASDLATLDRRMLTEWKIGDTPTHPSLWYVPYANAFVSLDLIPGDPDNAVLRYLPTDNDPIVTLGTAIRYFSGLVGNVEGTDYTIHADADQIPVEGYSWTQGQAKQSLDLLLELYDCEARIHDGIPQFIKRGSAVGALIETPEFVIEAGRPETRFKLTVANDTDLPRRAVLTYASTEADLQPATAKAERRLDSFDGVGELTIDATTVTLGPDDAQQLTERYFRRKHFSRLSAELRLSTQYLAIEPGDLRQFDFDGTTITMHVDKITDSADGSRHITCTSDDPAIAAIGAGVGSVSLGRPPSEIFAPGQSTGFVLDIPLASDADDQAAPFVYIAGGPVDPEASYVGTELHQSDTGDDDTYAPWDGTPSGDPATHGETTTELGDALPWVIDDGTALRVEVAGTLASITETQMLENGALNLAAVESADGWELVQFATATLVGTSGNLNLYDISKRLRGVRGTEQHIAGHALGDRFVMLDIAVARHAMGASEIGDEDWYIPAALGGTPNPANEFALEFEGNAHRPYAPVHGTLTLSGSDWEIDAVRRTRIGGSTVNGQDVPLGETSESWEADIYDGATFKRTISGTSLPLMYTAAQQTTDFGAPVTTGFEVNLYQMSPALSIRGFPLALAA